MAEAKAITALGDFGAEMCVQLLPMQNGVIKGRLEAWDVTGIALSEAAFLNSKTYVGYVFVPFVSIAYVTDKYTDGDNDDDE